MTFDIGSTVAEELRAELGRVLESVIPAGSPVALLDFPTHANVGDYAIWLGQVAYLRRTCRAVTYMCAHWDYSNERIAERLGDGTILLHGGGNLGDLWPSHQALREQVLADFPRRRVVQLPQSIHFRDATRLDSAKRAFASHPDFTLLVRDEQSFEFARDAFDCEVVLCPDSAFELNPLARERDPEHHVICLARTDQESVLLDQFSAMNDVEVVDWIHDPNRRYSTIRRTALGAAQLASKTHLASRLIARSAWAGFEQLATSQLRLGIEILSGGRVAVTDRLHGHILCLLLGTPHVMLDNSYGKLTSFHATWTAGSPLVRCAERPHDAVQTARQWAAAIDREALVAGHPAATATA